MANKDNGEGLKEFERKALDGNKSNPTQDIKAKGRQPDQQNHMKDQENRRA